MRKKSDDQSPSHDADVDYIIQWSREYIEELFENIVDFGVMISAEMERTDRAHRGRMSKLRNRFDREVAQYEKQKRELSELQRSRILTDRHRLLLRFRSDRQSD